MVAQETARANKPLNQESDHQVIHPRYFLMVVTSHLLAERADTFF